MEENLKRGDVLFDIGVADGWLSAIYAQFVGAENLCLFEPSVDSWPNIRSIWEANSLPTPRATFCGFVSNKTLLIPPQLNHNPSQRDGWPVAAYDDDLQEELHFRTIKERTHDTPQTTVDDFVARTGIIPSALSIDVEGAEVLVLRGAEDTLRKYHPLVWLSLHTINGAIFYDYGHSGWDALQVMYRCGYRSPEYLEIYGDEHWLFRLNDTEEPYSISIPRPPRFFRGDK